MVEPLALVALGVLVLAVVGSLFPLIPGALLSLVGVYGYWYATGYSQPGLGLLAALTLIGLLAFVADYFSGAISAAAGGGSLVTSALAGVVGLVLFFLTGPLGLVVGVVVTVFAAEFYRHGDPVRGARTAAYTVVGMLTSTIVQFLLTLTILVAMLAVAFL
ncbi:DUF456 domain-containing protein [Halococcus sp. IIIV-5B]|uniref:DUF456 domain-containing protein n=1 Tax=Halococcus sp. IIIV-5B TaxID=2321230 RepID=UPI000E72ED78|nr:DUF456 domain-containing protein [Halococcus sp. IIIV-5B]RJT05272.1 DUF456 domain-containing protein [Halococcus sp. IIIV-5B]